MKAATLNILSTRKMSEKYVFQKTLFPFPAAEKNLENAL